MEGFLIMEAEQEIQELVKVLSQIGVLPVDDLINAASHLTEEELTVFCLNSHNFRYAAMAATGRLASDQFDNHLDRVFQTLYHVPKFCFVKDVSGRKVISADRELSQDELDSFI